MLINLFNNTALSFAIFIQSDNLSSVKQLPPGFKTEHNSLSLNTTDKVPKHKFSSSCVGSVKITELKLKNNYNN